MSKARVTLSVSAVGDLEDILRWYRQEQVPDTGRRLVEETLQRIEALSDNPGIGRVVPEFGQKHLRELIHAPFRVVYRKESKTARVVRVWRSERLLILAQTAEELDPA